MQTFIDAPQLDEILDDFEEKRWLVRSGEDEGAQLTLTDAGEAKRSGTRNVG
jgi:hypothetical protein